MGDVKDATANRRWTTLGFCDVVHYVVEATVADERSDTYGPFKTNDEAEAFGKRWAERIADDLQEGEEWAWEIHEVLAVPADLAAPHTKDPGAEKAGAA